MERGDRGAILPAGDGEADDAAGRMRPGVVASGSVAPAAEREAAARLEQAHRICPGCGAAMVDRSCKLRCLRCGFFLDCSDG